VFAGSEAAIVEKLEPRSWKAANISVNTSLLRTCRWVYNESVEVYHRKLKVSIRGYYPEWFQRIHTQPIFVKLMCAGRLEIQFPCEIVQAIMESGQPLSLLRNLRFLSIRRSCFHQLPETEEVVEAEVLKSIERGVIVDTAIRMDPYSKDVIEAPWRQFRILLEYHIRLHPEDGIQPSKESSWVSFHWIR
jgi:hypothetical protein